MEAAGLSLFGIITVLLVVWYFGKSINSVTKGANEMASDEFKVFRFEQKIRLKKQMADISKRAEDSISDKIMSADELDKILAL